MLIETRIHRTLIAITSFCIVIGAIGLVSLSAYGHGGKTHAEEGFTAFRALEKAAQLYDRLITSGKLSEDWETGLKGVSIDISNAENEREYVVQFVKSEGAPNSVYFFFDREGKYSGSNFTGQ